MTDSQGDPATSVPKTADYDTTVKEKFSTLLPLIEQLRGQTIDSLINGAAPGGEIPLYRLFTTESADYYFKSEGCQKELLVYPSDGEGHFAFIEAPGSTVSAVKNNLTQWQIVEVKPLNGAVVTELYHDKESEAILTGGTLHEIEQHHKESSLVESVTDSLAPVMGSLGRSPLGTALRDLWTDVQARMMPPQ